MIYFKGISEKGMVAQNRNGCLFIDGVFIGYNHYYNRDFVLGFEKMF